MTRATLWIILAIAVLGALVWLFVWPIRFIDTRMPAMSAEAIARLMKNDEYFATYRTKWILVSGEYDSISYKTDEQDLTFKASGTSKVLCRIHNVNLIFRKNMPIQLQATDAHRDGKNIIFDDCRPLGSSPVL